MNTLTRFLVLCGIAALAPLYSPAAKKTAPTRSNWPSSYQGLPLTQLPMSELELRFQTNFPGAVARFTDGQREFILRTIESPTRKLHPSVDCMRGSGYTILKSPGPLEVNGTTWNIFTAAKNGIRLRVRERIYNATDSWTDVSAWYWSAIWGMSTAPWNAITIVEKEDSSSSQ